MAERFWAPGVALVGDAAHTTHPAGATGMNLAISSAARLAELVGPVLLASGAPVELDGALRAYDAERRPAASAAIERNHAQALRIWPPDPETDPEAYARAADPTAGWGVGGAGWGRDPAALSLTVAA
jgi:2-polyprenyl-6-methoxyphenol hydroxylase-like FAD-dependent oxidoreductase